jgi:hypothetical protein
MAKVNSARHAPRTNTSSSIDADAKLISLAGKLSELRTQQRGALEEVDRFRDAANAAQQRLEEIHAQMSATYRQMLQLRPTTLAGAEALARGIVANSGLDEVSRYEHEGSDEHGAAVLISALSGAPISEEVW